MYDIIKNVVNFTVSSQYMTTADQYMLSTCMALIVILTIVTLDWLRALFRSLINRIR